MGEINLDQDRRVDETNCPENAFKEGAMHTRLAGRDGGVAGRYTTMWHGRSPRMQIKCPVSENPGRHSSI